MMLLGILAAIGGAIVDLFNRVTSGSLGTPWTAVRGVWYANGSQAQSDDAASNYPIARVATGSANMEVSATVSAGTGVSFWVSDANNWYASVYYNQTNSYQCNCQTCTSFCCNTCTVTSSAYCGSAYGCSSGYVCQTSKCCVGGGSVIGNATLSPLTCTVTNCSACGQYACGSYSCNCSTCNDFLHYLRLSRAVSGTITQSVVSDVALSGAPAAIKVTTNAGTITGRAYSDAAMTNQTGTFTTTPAGAVQAARAGIIKTPSNTSQGSTVDNFTALG